MKRLSLIAGAVALLLFLPENSQAQLKIDGPDTIEPGAIESYSLTGISLEDMTAEEPQVFLICVPSPDQFFGVYDFIQRKPSALLRSKKQGVYTIILTTREPFAQVFKTVRVGEPVPVPVPEPTGWERWTKENAEALISDPERAKEARAMSEAMKATLSANAAGVFKSSAELRSAVKSANVQALVQLYGSPTKGRARSLVWEVKFNRVLEEQIRKKIPNLDLIPKAEWVKLYSGIAAGLGLVQ